MKKLFTLILLSLIMFSFACKKDEIADLESITPKDLAGTWELRSLEGGMRAPGPNPTFSPGNGNILKFSETTYEKFSEGKLVTSGTYKLSKENFYSSEEMKYRIIYDGDKDAYEEYVEMVDGKLRVYEGRVAWDGLEYLYEKITPGL